MSPICLGTLERYVKIDFVKMCGILKESFQNAKQHDLGRAKIFL